MSMHTTFGSIQLGTMAGTEAAAEPLSPQAPFRILILGDFSGRAAHLQRYPNTPLPTAKPVRVDRDSFEDVMARLKVTLPAEALGLTGDGLSFSELDDFLPERVARRLEVFDELRDTRARLNNPATFEATAAALRGQTQQAVPPTAETPAPNLAAVDPADLLAQMLGEDRPVPARAQRTEGKVGDSLTALVQKIVGPYLVPQSTPEQQTLVGLMDETIAAHLRGVLHHPLFQGLEAAWRGAYFLIRRLDTDNGLQIHLLDVSRAELAADLNDDDDLSKSVLLRVLVEQTVGTPGAVPWAVVLGNYTFGPAAADAMLLARLSLIAARSGAPFIAGASSTLAGCPSFAETTDPREWTPEKIDPTAAQAWQAVRQFPEAAALGLVLPRFLLRLPYGRNGNTCEGLEFEEITAADGHEAFLWGNGALACGCLLGHAYNLRGWSFRPGVVAELEGLPLYYRNDVNGEPTELPCAEALLSDRGTAALMELGLMPLLSVQRSDRIVLSNFQSLAEPSTPLRGRWQR